MASASPFPSLAAFLQQELYPAFPPGHRMELKEFAASTPILSSTPAKYTMSREQWMNRGYQQFALFRDLQRDKGLTDMEILVMRGYKSEVCSIALHHDVVVKSLELFCNKEQYDKWVPLAKDLRLIGSYAQTELGCGSDVRSLKTIATFDEARQEFVLNTPTPEALKWWIGVLSKSCTHAVVFARLILKGKDLGPHPFFVQVRDMGTHQPLPGVSIGDIGPKFGFAGMDNGYMGFKDFRVPHISMLARFSAVTPAGEYEFLNPEAGKLLFVAMLSTRTFIVRVAWHQLARGVTVALKYSHFRTQFKTVTENPTAERRLIDYQMQQRKLIPLLCSSYAMIIGGQALNRLFETLVKQLENDDASLLSEVHVLACACKSFYTWTTAEGLEVCRQSCGGHGFSSYSGLPAMYVNYLPNCTFEGDNSLLCFQVARFLVKTLRSLKKEQQVSPRFAFLAQDGERIEKLQVESFPHQVEGLRSIVRYYAKELLRKEEAAMGKKVTKKDAWNRILEIASIPAAKTLCWLFTLEEFGAAVSRATTPDSKTALDRLRTVFGLGHLYAQRAVLLRTGWLTPSQSDALAAKYDEKLKEMKAFSEAYADAFSFTEAELNSALISSDGKVYEKLLKWVQEYNPVTEKQPFPGVIKYLKPLAKL